MDALVFDQVDKDYRVGLFRRRLRALHGISFRVPQGASLGLIGPNGSGKTTTMGCALGLLRPSAGVVRLFGASPMRAAQRRGVGYLPERSAFPLELPARTLLRYYAQLAEVPAATRGKEVERWLERVGLAKVRSRRLGTYSKGMLRRFGLATALIGNPRLLVLDEPASGLDPQGSADLHELIRERREAGATLVLASHDLEAVGVLCDHTLLLQGGRSIVSGPVSEWLDTAVRGCAQVSGLEPEALSELSTWVDSRGARMREGCGVALALRSMLDEAAKTCGAP